LTTLARQQLANPFNPEDISWKPTDVKDGKCIALAYADKRVYEERLDLVFGPQNWGVSITSYSCDYRKVKKAKRKDWKDPNSEIISPEEILEGSKVNVIIEIAVNGFLSKASTGVSETDDENSITTAEAQAFKRACSMFGIGKYLYNLPRFNTEYKYGKMTDTPTLPDWALPAYYCSDCSKQIKTTQFKNKDESISSWNPTEILKRSNAHFGSDLCVDCMKKRRSSSDTAKAMKEKVDAANVAVVAEEPAAADANS
jgi:hypothetical protein